MKAENKKENINEETKRAKQAISASASMSVQCVPARDWSFIDLNYLII